MNNTLRWCGLSVCRSVCVLVLFLFPNFQGSLEAMELLIQNGATVDLPDTNGRTPLHVAAALGKTA